MHTGDLCFFTGASLFIVGVVGYFFTGPNNKGVYLLSSFVFFVVNVISVCMRKRLVRTVLIFTESSDQLSRATDRVPGLPASPGYVQ